MIYAHSREHHPESEWETLEEHALRVSDAARQKAEVFGAGEIAATLGLLHDLGKMKPGFQRKLAGEVNDTSHSGEGAKVLWDGIGAPLAAAIAGHHGRLPDPDKLRARIKAAEAISLPDWCQLPEWSWPPRLWQEPSVAPYRLQFLVRMLYGSLCDADDRETAAFYAGKTDRPAGVLTAEMRDAFDAFMENLGGSGPVNALRRRVLAHAQMQAVQEPGLFTLTVPTGGGKTLTSLGFGLEHAKMHGLKRLIYVVPYTSIIEQTVDVFRKVLGHEAVLEHHSNADWDGEDEDEAEQRRVMGASWDVPLVVTTGVQFFESLYAARKKRCRKLPSLAKSIIVLDEAQTMPLPLLRPCLAALRELIEGYGSSVVLSTATQPALTKAGGFPADEALVGAREIAPDPKKLFAALKRVEVKDVGPLNDATLADRLRNAGQALCIVDNRMQARAIFDGISDVPGARHLSTLMVPTHRRAVLAEVRKELSIDAPVRLVSTSLIEAGVDVDFPLVLRAAAGIDAVAQAAGRCNREAKLDLGQVEVFQSEHIAPAAIEQFAVIGRKVMSEGHANPIGEEAVARYFERLWAEYGADALDSVEVNGIQGLLKAIGKSGRDCPYEQIEASFQMIQDGQQTIVVCDGPWGIDREHLEALRYGSAGAVAKRVQAHSVNLPWRLWKTLWDEGHLAWWEPSKFQEQFAVLQTSALYDDRAGMSLAGEAGGIV